MSVRTVETKGSVKGVRQLSNQEYRDRFNKRIHTHAEHDAYELVKLEPETLWNVRAIRKAMGGLQADARYLRNGLNNAIQDLRGTGAFMGCDGRCGLPGCVGHIM